MNKIFGEVFRLCSQSGVHIVLRALAAVCEMSLDYTKKGENSKRVNRFYFRTARDLRELVKVTEQRANAAGGK